MPEYRTLALLPFVIVIQAVIHAAAWPQERVVQIDTQLSRVEWKGTKLHSSGSHGGSIGIKSGTIHMKHGSILGGKIIIDMKSIRVEDIPEADHIPYRALSDHLNEEFDVSQFPEASLAINSKKSNQQLCGVITIKGISKNFCCDLDVRDDEIRTAVKLNRSDFGIGKDSGWFARKLVDDTFMLSVVLKWK